MHFGVDISRALRYDKILGVFFVINIAQKRHFSCRLGISKKRVVSSRVESCHVIGGAFSADLRSERQGVAL